LHGQRPKKLQHSLIRKTANAQFLDMNKISHMIAIVYVIA
jgi:hypothetical protein